MPAPPALLETPRLQLRALGASDSEPLLALYQRNRPRLAASFPGAVAQVVDAAGAEAFILSKAAEREQGKGHWFGIWQGSALIGQIQIKNIEPGRAQAELAYLIDYAHEGQGFVAEALRRIVRACFEELALERVFLRTMVGNHRSQQLALRLGFTCDGTLPGDFLAWGTDRVDVHRFSLRAADARAQAPQR